MAEFNSSGSLLFWKPKKRVLIVNDALSTSVDADMSYRFGTAKQWLERIDDRLVARHTVHDDGRKQVSIRAVNPKGKQLSNYYGLSQYLMDQG